MTSSTLTMKGWVQLAVLEGQQGVGPWTWMMTGVWMGRMSEKGEVQKCDRLAAIRTKRTGGAAQTGVCGARRCSVLVEVPCAF